MNKTSKRRTSKAFLLANTALAWGLAFYGVYAQQGSAVVASALALIGSLYGAYVGIGHMDYRRFLAFFNQNGDPYGSPYNGPVVGQD
ncbi:hypothetical protein [Mesorhizobium sp.]|uniref:hypothetical protein n=1 Tax=Mesorhizobium sp. TaxID=1871066 RepID=UPI000FE7D2EB|nr:hypothetical protein [Mesorhizobium sp.]RWO57051.1 MAG: hypothetical protein EOS14_24570 [Mesorhizobium sp.]